MQVGETLTLPLTVTKVEVDPAIKRSQACASWQFHTDHQMLKHARKWPERIARHCQKTSHEVEQQQQQLVHAKTQVRNSSTHKPAENLFCSAAHLGPPSPRGPPTFRLRPPPNLSLARSLELNPNRFQGQTRSFRSGLGESRWKSPLHQVHQKLQAKLVLHKESGPCHIQSSETHSTRLEVPSESQANRLRSPELRSSREREVRTTKHTFSFGQVGLVNKPLNQTESRVSSRWEPLKTAMSHRYMREIIPRLGPAVQV